MFWVAVVPIEVYRCPIRTLHIHCCVRHFGTVNLMSFTIIIIEYSEIYKLITCCCRRTQSTRSIFGDSSTNGGWLTYRGPWKQSLMRNLRMYNRSLYLYTVLSSYLFNEGWQPTLRYHTATYCVGVSIRLFTILSHIINMISILNFYIVIVRIIAITLTQTFKDYFSHRILLLSSRWLLLKDTSSYYHISACYSFFQ